MAKDYEDNPYANIVRNQHKKIKYLETTNSFLQAVVILIVIAVVVAAFI